MRNIGGTEVSETENAQMVNAIGSELKDKYGTAGKLKKAMVENPADVLLTVMGGLGVAKNVAEANGFTQTAAKISKLQDVVNPVNVLKQEAKIVGKAVGKTAELTGKAVG